MILRMRQLAVSVFLAWGYAEANPSVKPGSGPAFSLNDESLQQGIRASVALEIKQQISSDIKREFSKLQEQMISQIKIELTSEVKKIQREVANKLDTNSDQVKRLSNTLDSTVQAVGDLDIKVTNINKQITNNMQKTNSDLVEQFYTLKNSITEDVSGFKIQLQQSNSHLDNFKVQTNDAVSSTLSAHTTSMYTSFDKIQEELISKVNKMQVALNKRLSQYNQFAMSEFETKELTLTRKMADNFEQLAKDLDISLQGHQDKVARVFDDKLGISRKQTDDNNSLLFTRVNSTMLEAVDRVQNQLASNIEKIKFSLRGSESNINNTLSNQVEEIQKYIRPTISQFQNTLTGETSRIKESMEEQFNEVITQVSDMKISVDLIKEDTGKVAKDIGQNQLDLVAKSKLLDNKMDVNTVKLNKTLNNAFYDQKTELVMEISKLRKAMLDTFRENQNGMQTMFDQSVVKATQDALDQMKTNMEDIVDKLQTIEDEKEDLIPTLQDSMRNIVDIAVEKINNNNDDVVKTPIEGKLDTLQKLIEKISKRVGDLALGGEIGEGF